MVDQTGSQMSTFNFALNRLTVLKAIRNGGPIARTDLQELTGLSSATITQVTGELIGRGLIVERKDAAKRNGRPRIFLEIDPSGGIIVGASFSSRRRMTFSFVDLAGEVLFETQAASSLIIPTHEDLVTRTAQALEMAIVESGFRREQIARVAVSLPALVDSVKGTFYFMSTFPLGPFPLAERISSQLRLPVSIENEMNCIARYEHWFGRAQQLDTFTIIDLAHAIGAAQYRSGFPICGSHGITSQLGHVKLHPGPEGRRCYCGATGCANAYASIYGILTHANRIAPTVPPTDDLDQAFDNLLLEATAGSNEARDLLSEAGWHLGLLVANHINATDPGYVMILVPDARFTEFARESFDRALHDNALPGLLPFTEVCFEIASEEGSSKGIAAMALEQSYIAEPMRRRPLSTSVN
jgi:transcriptional regulator of PTS gene